jgi:RimJ/RimL family protein N-acetyltransferase
MTDTVGAVDMLMAAHRAAGWQGSTVPAWWLHQIVLDGVVVGDVGFHGPAGDGMTAEVEIGYSVVAPLRGRGVATRACGLIVERAWRDGAAVVSAETDADNVASQQVLLRSGFRATGHFRYVLERPTLVRAAS